jgi:hypothetical protein
MAKKGLVGKKNLLFQKKYKFNKKFIKIAQEFCYGHGIMKW